MVKLTVGITPETIRKVGSPRVVSALNTASGMGVPDRGPHPPTKPEPPGTDRDDKDAPETPPTEPPPVPIQEPPPPPDDDRGPIVV